MSDHCASHRKDPERTTTATPENTYPLHVAYAPHLLTISLTTQLARLVPRVFAENKWESVCTLVPRESSLPERRVWACVADIVGDCDWGS